MNFLLLTLFASSVLLASADAKAIDSSDAVVEIERQRLVKFPDEVDQQRNDENQNPSTNNKTDEAKRILEEIEKINKALGYVKKQPDQPKVPPALDSSQYLFPKPAYHPFHSQNHQIAGSHGETLLVPSIRAVKMGDSQAARYNLPVAQQKPGLKSKQEVTPSHQRQFEKETQPKATRKHAAHVPNKHKTQYYYRPNNVLVPAANNGNGEQTLPTHFVIPVRLYKLNKEEYLKKHAPQEYRVKGYKIVGDVDDFYAKSHPKQSATKMKSAHKYHLFFLPRDLALNEDSTFKYNQTEAADSGLLDAPAKGTTAQLLQDVPAPEVGSREQKLQNKRPNKNNQTTSQAALMGVPQRKRVVPKPAREGDATIEKQSTTTSSPAHITPPTLALPAHNRESASNKINYNLFNNNNKLITAASTPSKQNASTIIKNAFQNVFKLPFRPVESKPESETSSEAQPQKTFFAAQQSIYPSERPQRVTQDYNWDEDDGSNSNSAGENEGDASGEPAEQKVFGQFHKHHQDTQREAIKQGGIIIQRLKVRKGGIAIAGPGGVATAGSGGTAIVGPGGYALTHPRSLTIAGPGAKVISIPADVDLKDALQRTDLSSHSFPREGKIVATGPTVYYSPGTGLSAEAEEVL